GGSYTLSGLTDVDGSGLHALSGGQLALPGFTSYVSNFCPPFQADGSGSVLDVSHLTTVTQQGGWNIFATNHGTLKLSALTGLTSTNGITIQDTGSSTLLDGMLTTLTGVINATLDVTDAQVANSLSPFSLHGALPISGGSYTLSGLTDVDGSGLH